MGDKLLSVRIITPEKIIFQGKAERVILPGESGVFEVLPFHKQLLSRLFSGNIIIDEQLFPVYRGIVQVISNRITILMENRANNEQAKSEK